ncbi:protein O-linked-mannose beta-1,4-N-acetylglucosaminyltransferase 2-like [Argiope bruennichi]|uniref:EGF domain-specific O-linked like protein n=1 Tax=Argiope bruennichi TaxID=94029 RepID=A0A8T0EEX8_ARGBR|nr:protein O-linked-mannose beta-1,4-N-acetylglucosaminyltransferase 2-like [Argiope bruennichi]XP_055953755.1 protein O-linked-mannose beta-1,4-N-acetylglucosaminyltransferase 2-like [Argiope bruennichi]XP_055953756.1 protein O-linked-mannose beta-1,4-N-acetylglucosaminyltransferase 2-like [Argiope bruennichi]KAF8771662.1 EGF domain-specific O-linked like protein [Argiope bruennichi]
MASVICGLLTLLVTFIIHVSSAPTCTGKSSCGGQSQVSSYPGHWPSNYCKVNNVVFSTGDRVLRVDGDIQELDKCHKVRDVWKFESSSTGQQVNNIVCDQVFTRGHFFTTYYFHGSNYFHLHYDTMLPLFVALHQDINKLSSGMKDVTLLPGIEVNRGEGIDWDTDAFDDQNSYWMQMLQMLSKPHRLLPLDRKLAGINKTICFQEAYFGTPKVDFSSPDLLQSYADFAKKTFGIKPIKSTDKTGKPKIGLIHREGRRKILNEDELIKSIASVASVDVLDFSQMSVKEQIQKVQQYNVLIGMNGAGLVNALYLPKTSVAVQLVPYKAQLNVEEFANLLKTRGPYLEWHNNHPELDRRIPEDIFRNGADTIVDANEFVQIVNRALQMYKESSKS